MLASSSIEFLTESEDTLTSSKASLRSLFDTKIACSLFDLNINAGFLNVPFV